jgi:hypothetical protein
MENTLEKIRNWLRADRLWLDKSDDDDTGVLEAVDSFVELSQGSTTVLQVMLYPYDEDAWCDELWDKVGRGVGNLKYLDQLNICLNNYNEGDEPNPDWEILARILRHCIKLDIGNGYTRGTQDMRAFATAIQGHPAITSVETHGSFRFESTDILCSALATLPNLEDVILDHRTLGREEVPELGRPESVSELLRAPSL